MRRLTPIAFVVTSGLAACFFEPSKPGTTGDAHAIDTRPLSDGSLPGCVMPTIHDDFGIDGPGCGNSAGSNGPSADIPSSTRRSGGLLLATPNVNVNQATAGCTVEQIDFTTGALVAVTHAFTTTTAYTQLEIYDVGASSANVGIEIVDGNLIHMSDPTSVIGDEVPYDNGQPSWLRLVPVGPTTVEGSFYTDASGWHVFGTAPFAPGTDTVKLRWGGGIYPGMFTVSDTATFDSYNECP